MYLLVIFLLFAPTLQTANPYLFIKPIMYGTALALFFIGFFVVYWMYGLTHEKDNMIYSKFLSVRKAK